MSWVVPSESQVLIAGAGPVGMALAIDLAHRGTESLVVERLLRPRPLPNGQNLTQRTMESLHRWGVADSIRSARIIPKSFGIAGLTAYGSLLSDHTHDWLQRGKVAQYYSQDNDRLPQNETERVLGQRAAQRSAITLLRGWTVRETSIVDGGVETVIEETHGDGTAVVQSTYVVGCEGARSAVRQSLGFTETREEHDRRMVLLVFQSRELHELVERYPGKSYFNIITPELDGYWKFFGRVDLGQRWFFHAPVPRSTTADNFDFCALVHEAVGQTVPLAIEHVGFWDLRMANADHYRLESAFLAGDAAHSHPPYGGFGINIGFEDARNLAWKLDARLNGWGGDALLTSYTEERQPVFASAGNDFIGRMIRDDRQFVRTYNPAIDRKAFDAAWAERAKGGDADVFGFAPNYAGSPVIVGDEPGPPSSQGTHETRARAGHHFTPLPLPGGQTTHAILGNGFTLFDFSGCSQAAEHLEQAAKAAGVPLKRVHRPSAFHQKAYGCSLVLVRPDDYVAWAGTDLRDTGETLIETVAGR